ncbi:hypothetical protein QNI16_01270 [Cytophagaceae bacterium YF14B1]|uniref:Uncharacterized protein n=1 Tax=Xanthocytophaga flava TaxID=3048013 RepID=A0AAE3QI72_9BACT|nr:hypothetical protein [Xanthocytophaga flavus]MDJ1466434.1 hypothetical protein [Xanthocytophaga flavus]MDJ1479091.1 hypothetical protein [Xanthocytophaga flavus]
MKFLKKVMLVNAISSGATGLILLVFAPLVADLFGTSAIIAVEGTGLFLLCFAALVLFEALKNPMRPAWVNLIIVLDISWVLISVLVIVFQLFHLSLLGYALIGAVALWVAAMAYLQSQGLKQLSMA